jgi:hypothetical protein
MIGYGHTCIPQGSHFTFGRSALSFNDCASMAHPSSWRGSTPGNKGCDRLAHILVNIVGRLFFRVTANLANKDYLFRLWIVLEKL